MDAGAKAFCIVQQALNMGFAHALESPELLFVRLVGILAVKGVHGGMEHAPEHAGVEIFLHFVGLSETLHGPVVEGGLTIQIVPERRGTEVEVFTGHHGQVLFGLGNALRNLQTAYGRRSNVTPHIEAVEEFELFDKTALLAGAYAFGA